MNLHIGVDIGGTFTDVVGARTDGKLFIEKVLSSTHDYSAGILKGIAAILKRSGVPADNVVEVVHATTVATNAILEGRGAKTALITTRGFRDVLDIRLSRRPDMYNIDWVKPPPLVDRYLRCEVDERIDAQGRVIRALDEQTVIDTIDWFKDNKVESVAVCLINSFANECHEKDIGRLLRHHAPDMSISLSCEVLPEAKEYERTSTTCINAYIRPLVERYLTNLISGLQDIGIHAPLLTMQSNGGIMSWVAAASRPANIVESGPAAGVIGAVALAQRFGVSNAITFDMGGTTAKAAWIEDGKLRHIADLEVGSEMSALNRLNKGGGYALSVPSVDVAEVGAGGGSVAWIDEGNVIRVGPRSAGASPGPVSYGAGGDEITVTDANLLLGYLNPSHLVGGGLKLDLAAARDAIRSKMADRLAISAEDGAYGINRVANAVMARAIRAISTERGRDPREACLIAFGGNGPVHAAEVARAMGIKKVIIPTAPGVFSAYGLLNAPVEHSYSRTHLNRLDGESCEAISKAFELLKISAEEDLRATGHGDAEIRWRLSADLRYQGQASQLNVSVPSATIDATTAQTMRLEFESEHRREFGYFTEGEALDVMNVRVSARLKRNAVPAQIGSGKPASDNDDDASDPNEREVYFGPQFGQLRAKVFGRGRSLPTNVTGPAVIEGYDSTIVVPPGCHADTDELGNTVIDVAGAQDESLLAEQNDFITCEIVRHALESIADEMALTLTRTCRSAHVKHSGDFSTAIADGKGQLLAQGLTLPFHLGALPDALDAILQQYSGDMFAGDVFVMNDPFGGGMHLPDIFIMKPIFYRGRMVATAAAIVHQVDIGGRVAGGNSTTSTEIYAEGLRLPLLKLVEKGEPNESVFKIISSNVRVPVKVVGDIRAQLAACARGEKDYLSLVERLGMEIVTKYQEQILSTSEKIARKTISEIPDGVYEFQDFMDGDSIDPDPIPIHVSLHIAGETALVDCSRSSPQVRGAVNSTLSVTKSMAYTALRCIMPSHTSSNSGYMRPISVIAKPGSILNGALPAAGAGRAATGYRLMDTIFGALAKAVPDRIMAAGDGSPIIFAVGGYDEDLAPFVFVDLMRGSWGARPHADGLDGTALACSTGSSVPAEIVELEHPVRLEFCGYVPNSCGAGRFRGGMAVMREYRLLAAEASLQYRSERRKFRPYGLAGGLPGSPSIAVWNPAGEARLLAEKGEIRMRRGDVIRFCQAGGGGHGDPMSRDPEHVRKDVRDELVSVENAAEFYGVIIDPKTGAVMSHKTKEARCANRRTVVGEAIEVVPATPDDISQITENCNRIASAGRGGGQSAPPQSSFEEAIKD